MEHGRYSSISTSQSVQIFENCCIICAFIFFFQIVECVSLAGSVDTSGIEGCVRTKIRSVLNNLSIFF